MEIHKKKFEDLCNIHKMDTGIDPVASWRKIQEYYCSQLSYDVCSGYCFYCIDTIEAMLKLQNSGAPDEKLIEYATEVTKQMTEKYNNEGSHNPYNNEYLSPLDSFRKRQDEQNPEKTIKRRKRSS